MFTFQRHLRFAWMGAALPCAAIACAAISAHAQEPEQEPEADSPPPPPEVVQVERPRTEKRPVPNYDRRPEQPTDAGDVALWVPRVLAFPFYLVTEFVIRRPLGWLVVTAEREDWPTTLIDFFTFDEEQKIGWVPTAFFDFGFKPSVGLYFFADDVFVEGNDIRANVGFWGTDWLKFAARDRVQLDETTEVQLGGSWVRRPDYLFHGIGPRTEEGTASRYSADIGEAFLSYDIGLWRWSSFEAQVGVRDVTFRESSCCGDPSIQERARAGELAVPAGFESGYTAGYARVRAALDTREPEPAAGHGMRVEAFGEQNVEVDPDRLPNRWVKYGGKVGGFLDLTGHRRVLSFWLASSFVDPLGGRELAPFPELALLGGSQEMRGFREGRLHGRSALVSTLQYDWPVWVWLQGTLHVAAGNVFGEHLEDFEPELLRLSSAIGFRSMTSDDHYLEVLTGVGTETYEQGWEVSSFRLLLGGNSGF
ncbi:MAG: hypothetical protein ACOC1F_00605 [Myxococcota bacterium]